MREFDAEELPGGEGAGGEETTVPTSEEKGA